MKPRIVCIGGGTASGKSTLADLLAQAFGTDSCRVLAMDNYYCDNSHLSLAERNKLNYDHPKAYDFPLIHHQLSHYRNGDSIDTPQYDFATHARTASTIKIAPHEILIFEGILALHNEELRKIFHYTIYVDTNDALRYERRLERDIRERGRTKESVIAQWQETVLPMHQKYCAPTMSCADRVVDGEGDFRSIVNGLVASIRQ